MDRMYQYATTAGTRYAQSQPLDGLIEVTRADAFPQRPGALDALLGSANGEALQHEDAFTVRVQAPENASGLPVVVFIPGGGFLSGTGTIRWFDQAAEYDHVLVTVNYRLGVLGHLGPAPTPEASQRPLGDLLNALNWVQTHIANFGGDPGNITLAGDSAGAWYSFALATLPQTVGLFRRLALVSLPRQAPQTISEYQARWEYVQQHLHGEGGFESAELAIVLDAQQAVARQFAGQGMALMPAEGSALPDSLHDYQTSVEDLHVEEILLISTDHEAQAFLLSAPEQAFDSVGVEGFTATHFDDPDRVMTWVRQQHPDSTKQQMAALITLYQFTQANLELAMACARTGKRIFVGGFGVPSPLTGGSPHCMTLPFLFGQRRSWHDAPMLESIPEEGFNAVADALRSWFFSFATDGQPVQPNNEAKHPAFTVDEPQRLDFGLSTAAEVTIALTVPETWALAARTTSSTRM